MCWNSRLTKSKKSKFITKIWNVFFYSQKKKVPEWMGRFTQEECEKGHIFDGESMGKRIYFIYMYKITFRNK